jgi:hypothetical protein
MRGQQRHQHAGVAHDVRNAQHRQHRKPHQRDWAEHAPHHGGAKALREEEQGQHDQGHWHHEAVQTWRGNFQALDRTQHTDGRRDHPVAKEDGRAEDAQQQQARTQHRPVFHRLRGQCQHRDQAAFAVVVGAQDQGHVLERDHHRQRPEHQAQDAQDVLGRERHAAVREDFLQRIERAGADVAIDNADGPQREASQCAGAQGIL